MENKLKALKARNDYLLCIDSANAALQKYFLEDFPKLAQVSFNTLTTRTLPGTSYLVCLLGYDRV